MSAEFAAAQARVRAYEDAQAAQLLRAEAAARADAVRGASAALCSACTCDGQRPRGLRLVLLRAPERGVLAYMERPQAPRARPNAHFAARTVLGVAQGACFAHLSRGRRALPNWR